MNLMPAYKTLLWALPISLILLLTAGPYVMIGFSLLVGCIQAVRGWRARDRVTGRSPRSDRTLTPVGVALFLAMTGASPLTASATEAEATVSIFFAALAAPPPGDEVALLTSAVMVCGTGALACIACIEKAVICKSDFNLRMAKTALKLIVGATCPLRDIYMQICELLGEDVCPPWPVYLC